MQNKLKQTRESLGLSQSKVAVGIGATQRAYQNYERGTQSPSVHKAIAIAKMLNSTVEELFTPCEL